MNQEIEQELRSIARSRSCGSVPDDEGKKIFIYNSKLNNGKQKQNVLKMKKKKRIRKSQTKNAKYQRYVKEHRAKEEAIANMHMEKILKDWREISADELNDNLICFEPPHDDIDLVKLNNDKNSKESTIISESEKISPNISPAKGFDNDFEITKVEVGPSLENLTGEVIEHPIEKPDANETLLIDLDQQIQDIQKITDQKVIEKINEKQQEDLAKPVMAIEDNTGGIAINGLDHLGRAILLAAVDKGIKVVAINEPFITLPLMVSDLQNEMMFSKKKLEVRVLNTNTLEVGENKIKIFADNDLSKVPWDEMNVKCIVDSDPFSNKQLLEKIKTKSILAYQNSIYPMINPTVQDCRTTAKIISQPLSAVSAILPILTALKPYFTIEKCFFHITKAIMDKFGRVQCPVQSGSNPDFKNSIVPYCTDEISSQIGSLFPSLFGTVHGNGVLVPAMCVSMINLNLTLSKNNKEDSLLQKIKAVLKEASEGEMKNQISILPIQESKKLSSSMSLAGDPHSCIINSNSMKMIRPFEFQVQIWFDNESSHIYRLLQLCST